MRYTVYTDGSCLKNPGGPGGCAALLIDEESNKRMLTASFKHTTNNRMELMAFILALRNTETEDEIAFVSDSQYAMELVTGKYKHVKKNNDLAELITRESKNRKISYDWIKGHDGDRFNEACDRAAVKAAKDTDAEIDYGYESTCVDYTVSKVRIFPPINRMTMR